MKSKQYNLQPLAGMAEFTPAQQLQFERWKTIVAQTYSLYGFTPIESPILERSEILFAKVGEGTTKQIYRFSRGDADISLRFDLTVPLARYVAAYQNELHFPFRRQHLGRVYRGERAQAGRYREFYQADADIVGRGELDLKYDAEIIALIIDTITRLELGEFQVSINNRQLVVGFLQSLKVLDEQKIITLLDNAEKIGPKKLQEELRLLRLDGLEIRRILQFAAIKGSYDEFYQALMRLDVDNPEFTQGLEQLGQIAQILQALQIDPAKYCFNVGVIRGLDYYTGTVFETKLLANQQLGSICGGGRYDNLVREFAREKMPGVGMSIGLTRLFSQACRLGLVKLNQKTCSRVAILPLTEDITAVMSAAATLRAADINTEIYLQTASFTKKIKYAGDLGIPFAVIIGDDEVAAAKITLRDLQTGEQNLLTLPQAIDLIKR